jgi:hypothetical protein
MLRLYCVGRAVRLVAVGVYDHQKKSLLGRNRRAERDAPRAIIPRVDLSNYSQYSVCFQKYTG